jgi:hypothetical protein
MQTTCQRGLINYDNSKSEEIKPDIQGFYATNHARVLFFANHDALARRRFYSDRAIGQATVQGTVNAV